MRMALQVHNGMVKLVAEGALQKIRGCFPQQGCSYAFAYGSGVFQQENQKTGKMIDLVFVVNDAREWHKENLKINRSHYSAMKYLGSRGISWVQERMASGVYYNPFVSIGDQLVKYGVVPTALLEEDLFTWSQLYIAGRLHKPVYDLIPPQTEALAAALLANREAAVRAVLLQSGRYISKFDMYYGVAELSYLGDTRMRLGENPQKVNNIVAPMMNEFEQVYERILRAMHPHVEINSEGVIVQNTSPPIRFQHLMQLPSTLQRGLARQVFKDTRLTDIEEIMGELSFSPQLGKYLRKSIAETVWTSSIWQTMQGILSAGVVRSIKYGWEKIQKKRMADKKKRKEDRERSFYE